VRHRQAIAVLALAGLFVSLYLWLWKIGRLGALQCGTGGCERVQTSEWAVFLGLPVAFYGVVGYAALLATSLVGLQPRFLERREPTIALAAMASLGVAFSAYLTWLELAVIHAWCRWCVGSAVIITGIWVAALTGLRRRA
jgi:uncharacterized membrane protein